MRHPSAERSRFGAGRAWLATLAAILTATLGAEMAMAQALPPVNLGFTSFLDGGPPAGPGFYFQQYIQYFASDQFKNHEGDTIPLLGDLDLWVSLSQGIYQSNQPVLFGGKWGIDVIVPFVHIDVDPGTVPVLSDNGGGLGDLLVGPYIQWDPIMGKKGPIFMHRIELQTLFPTGKYDDDRVLNPGSNFYSFNPYWSGTLFIAPHLKASVRLHYLWNSKNEDPNTTLFPTADDTRAGQAIHLNFSSALEVVPNKLHVGVNGYYLKQITRAQVDGHKVDDSEEQVLGIGPGAVWHISRDNHLFLNFYVETQTENRPEGMRLNMRYTHHF